ncbi:hypothetical protein GJ744_006259 [Endocarpon pusillum]|uniref:Uncharacterized protein n=1 Tax=Endocarpon pusillum TaxID=364733 RepID=A0A8H7AMA0_9EURO|nr:hypothetical protein GJ744_006259 [Endocarpon pusillum]
MITIPKGYAGGKFDIKYSSSSNTKDIRDIEDIHLVNAFVGLSALSNTTTFASASASPDPRGGTQSVILENHSGANKNKRKIK